MQTILLVLIQMMVLTRKTKTIKYDRLVLTYLCSILLTNSYAPEPNPGPPKYPCGSCNKACTWKQKAYVVTVVISGTT